MFNYFRNTNAQDLNCFHGGMRFRIRSFRSFPVILGMLCFRGSDHVRYFESRLVRVHQG